MISISHDEAEKSSAKSLFNCPPPPGGEVNLVATENGPMLVRKADSIIGSMLATHGRFEEDTLIDVTRFLCEKHGFTPKQFVDIGANIGTHILRALRGGYFESGVAVEMDPDNFRLLECNVRLNLVDPSVRLMNTAVGEKIGIAKMERSPDNLGDHRIRGAPSIRQDMYGEKNRVSANVPMTTLDQMELDYHLKFDASTLLWIDTQGYEGHVLQGANQIMQRSEGDRPIIVLEFWPYGLDRVDGFSRLIRRLEVFGSLRNLRAKNWQTAPAIQAVI
jgi:FkbM family methyltransferase